MAGVRTANQIRGVLRKHIRDEATVQLVVADLEMSLGEADYTTRCLFRLLGSVARDIPERDPGPSHPEGRWVNKGTKSWS